MVQPPALKYGERRFSIIGAAQEIFIDQGYESARIAAIAARAGTSVGAVYYHFENKATLFNAVWTEINRSQRGRFEEGVDRARQEGISDLVPLVCAGAFAFWNGVWSERGAVRLILKRERPDSPADIDSLFRITLLQLSHRNRNSLDQRDPFERRALVSVVLAIFTGGARELVLCDSQEEASRLVEHFIAILMRVIGRSTSIPDEHIYEWLTSEDVG